MIRCHDDRFNNNQSTTLSTRVDSSNGYRVVLLHNCCILTVLLVLVPADEHYK
jgi:hypothetical protein